MKIRRAKAADADEGIAVLKRSIVELCVADHGGDPNKVAEWTANKSKEMWLAWCAQEATSLFVALGEARIVGVGMMKDNGEILLNYVSPDARFTGVSRALLSRMEAEARGLGLACCVLESTETAREFYRTAGYESEQGSPTRMTKYLSY